MAEKKTKNLGDKLSDLLAKGVSTVEKNSYEKAEVKPSVEEAVAPVEAPVEALPVVEKIPEESVVAVEQPDEENAAPVEEAEPEAEVVAEDDNIEISENAEIAETEEESVEVDEPAKTEEIAETSEVEAGESKVSAITPEELAAAMGEKDPYETYKPVQSDNPNVSAITPEELAAARGEEYVAPAVEPVETEIVESEEVTDGAIESEENAETEVEEAEEVEAEDVEAEVEETAEVEPEMEETEEIEAEVEETEEVETEEVEPEMEETEEVEAEEVETEEVEEQGPSAEELEEMKAAFDKVKVSSYEIEEVGKKKEEEEYFDLDVVNETTPVKQKLTPEEIEKQKRDAEMLSKLDEQTRREYEYLARRYSRNPIGDQNKIVTVASGDYDEEFDFEKRTDIKKVSTAAKKKPLLIASICIALVLAIFLPVYFLVIAKPKVEPVVLKSLKINQSSIYQYKGTYVELDNVYMTATYSNGATKKINCSKDNISSKPSFISEDLLISADTAYESSTIQFEYEGKTARLTVNFATLTMDGLIARVYNTRSIVIGEAFDISNFDILKTYTATGNFEGTIEKLPSSVQKYINQSDYANITVKISKDGGAAEEFNLQTIVNNGGFVFDEAGAYNIEFVYNSFTASVNFDVA